MLMAYIDESGDTGDPALGGSSNCYVLGCVLTDDLDWPGLHDGVIGMRRRLRDTYGLPMRAEVKANYLTRGGGPLRRMPQLLSPAERGLIYRAHLSQLSEHHTRAFAVVIDKEAPLMAGKDIFDVAWTTLLNRIERTCTIEHSPVVIHHDNGENDAVRKIVRRARRHLTAGSAYGAGYLQFKADMILDDPVPRESSSSYLIQIADLVAYAGWRTYRSPSLSVAQVCPSNMWDALGGAQHAAVNKLSGGRPGVVVRTK